MGLSKDIYILPELTISVFGVNDINIQFKMLQVLT